LHRVYYSDGFFLARGGTARRCTAGGQGGSHAATQAADGHPELTGVVAEDERQVLREVRLLARLVALERRDQVREPVHGPLHGGVRPSEADLRTAPEDRDATATIAAWPPAGLM